MKLLVVTRKVDIRDGRMGFFVDWLNEFAEHADLSVISMQPGSKEGLNKDIKIHFVKKGIFGKISKYLNYKKLLKQLVPETDGIFIHMIPLYANIAGPVAKRHKKKMYLWYTHKSVDRALRKTEQWVTGYVTASRESFRFETKKKVNILSHGIPAEKFSTDQASKQASKQENIFNIITVGRVSPSKNLETLIEALNILTYGLKLTAYRCKIIGAPALDADKKYLEKLKSQVKNLGIENKIDFVGAKSHTEVVECYKQTDLAVNLSKTGSVDKSVLEAMASKVLVITSNQAFKGILDKDLIIRDDSRTLANKINHIMKMDQFKRKELGDKLRNIIIRDHNLADLIKKILSLY